jgi:hypothetical protein
MEEAQDSREMSPKPSKSRNTKEAFRQKQQVRQASRTHLRQKIFVSAKLAIGSEHTGAVGDEVSAGLARVRVPIAVFAFAI